MSLNRQILLFVAVLAAVVAFFELTNVDLWAQDHFYDFQTRRWLIDADEPVLRAVLYTAVKGVAIAVGVACGAGFALSWTLRRLAPHRRRLLLMALSLILVPLTVSAVKQTTNVFLPRQIERYGGRMPYVKVLERYPPGFRSKSRGRGWPAGHASGGFALMMSYFALRRRGRHLLGLAGALTLGWAMGLYQTLNGEHYLSHTIVTMCAAWTIILIIRKVVGPPDPSPASRPAAAKV